VVSGIPVWMIGSAGKNSQSGHHPRLL